MSVADFSVVIPARYASTRLPAKPLLLIAGKPMIEHVHQRALESGAKRVVVATDDERIERVVKGFGGQVVMTAVSHASGTDRLAEVASTLAWPDDHIVVNLQGDEPLMKGALVARMADVLAASPEAGMSTLAARIEDPAEIFDPNVVKVVLDARGLALYFSRAPIPWVRGVYGTSEQRLVPEVPVLRHFGLYGYRVRSLMQLARAPVAPLEAAESLEQLRALHMGIGIRVDVTGERLARGVDTEEDLRAVDRLMTGMRGV